MLPVQEAELTPYGLHTSIVRCTARPNRQNTPDSNYVHPRAFLMYRLSFRLSVARLTTQGILIEDDKGYKGSLQLT